MWDSFLASSESRSKRDNFADDRMYGLFHLVGRCNGRISEGPLLTKSGKPMTRISSVLLDDLIGGQETKGTMNRDVRDRNENDNARGYAII